MKDVTLLILVRDGKVLLGRKKCGEIGKGTLNGPGGKLEEGESIVDCMVRETMEEVGLALDRGLLEETAKITFYVGDKPAHDMYIFYSTQSEGEPVETDEMTPHWFDIDNLPLNEMLESDREWFAKVVRKERFSANVYYREKASGFVRIEFNN